MSDRSGPSKSKEAFARVARVEGEAETTQALAAENADCHVDLPDAPVLGRMQEGPVSDRRRGRAEPEGPIDEKIAERRQRRRWCFGILLAVLVCSALSATLGAILGGGGGAPGASGGSSSTASSDPTQRAWTPNELKQFIIAELGTSRGFDLPGFTPTKAAYQLILDGSTFNNISLGAQLMDAFVLLALYTGTGGTGGTGSWARSDGWNEVPDPCEWFGIQCNAERRVSGISLPSNNVVGPLVPDLRYLEDSFTYMDFSDNQVMLIKFNLPALPNLAHVNLSQNSLNAETLESSLAYNLTKLEVLDFSHNQLSGPVLPAISLLPRLRALHLQDNLLTGPVPPELASLAELSSLRLEDNRLSGSVPDGLCRRANVSVDCRRVSCAAACCRCE